MAHGLAEVHVTSAATRNINFADGANVSPPSGKGSPRDVAYYRFLADRLMAFRPMCAAGSLPPAGPSVVIIASGGGKASKKSATTERVFDG